MDDNANLINGIDLAIRRGDFPWLIKFFSSKKALLLSRELIQSYMSMCRDHSDFAKLSRECGLEEILEKLLDADD